MNSDNEITVNSLFYSDIERELCFKYNLGSPQTSSVDVPVVFSIGKSYRVTVYGDRATLECSLTVSPNENGEGYTGTVAGASVKQSRKFRR